MTSSFCRNGIHGQKEFLLLGLGIACLTFISFFVQTVKVADFGVARVKAQSGVMTAETGTYRWMAPEVILYY